MRGSRVIHLCAVAMTVLYGLTSLGVLTLGRTRSEGDPRARTALSSSKAGHVLGLRVRHDDVSVPACDCDAPHAWLYVFAATLEGTVAQPAVVSIDAQRHLLPAPRPPPSA